MVYGRWTRQGRIISLVADLVASREAVPQPVARLRKLFNPQVSAEGGLVRWGHYH